MALAIPSTNAVAHVAARTPRPPSEPAPIAQPVRRRSRSLAIILAALAITYLPLSLHNFYLGYYGRGAIAIALLLVGGYLLLLGATGILFSSARVLFVSYIGVAIVAGWYIWQLSDLLRIIRGELKPKEGEYK